MTRFSTFEQLIVRKEVGYVCDETSMANLTSEGSYDGAVFKLIAKCETALLLLSSHKSVDQFTFDVVVIRNPARGEGDKHEALSQAWRGRGSARPKVTMDYRRWPRLMPRVYQITDVGLSIQWLSLLTR